MREIEGLKGIGRLAMREEGNWWNAYYAMFGTMEKAIHLGSIKINIVRQSKPHKEAFMNLMREVVADYLEEATGVRPVWGGPERAAESERSGSA